MRSNMNLNTKKYIARDVPTKIDEMLQVMCHNKSFLHPATVSQNQDKISHIVQNQNLKNVKHSQKWTFEKSEKCECLLVVIGLIVGPLKTISTKTSHCQLKWMILNNQFWTWDCGVPFFYIVCKIFPPMVAIDSLTTKSSNVCSTPSNPYTHRCGFRYLYSSWILSIQSRIYLI